MLSALIVLWSRTRPGFDPYGWLVWGRQTLAGNLDTNAAPSWKPLPYLFTVPYALLGHLQVRAWMVTSVAVSLSGAAFAGRIAHRLTLAAGPDARVAAGAAAGLAAVSVLSITGYSHYVLSAQSDPMIVSLCLAAVDAQLAARHRTALVLGTLAGLGRPEVWPFLALLGGWLWLRRPATRPLVAGCALATLLLWFGIPALTSRTPFVAASNALGSGRRLHNDKVLGTISRYLGTLPPGILIAAAVGVVVALRRRERTLLALAAGILAWLVVEIGFALHGWPGLARYMFEASGVTAVLGAVAVGRLLALGSRPNAPARKTEHWLALAAAACVVLSLAPALVSRVSVERRDLRQQRERTVQLTRLATVVDRLGGPARLRACGEPVTELQDQTALAWQLGINVSRIGFKFSRAIRRGNPVILFHPTHRGWRVVAVHQRRTSCRRLPR